MFFNAGVFSLGKQKMAIPHGWVEWEQWIMKHMLTSWF